MPPLPKKTKRRGEVVELSTEQSSAIHQLLAFPKTVQTLGGYAGTGKNPDELVLPSVKTVSEFHRTA